MVLLTVSWSPCLRQRGLLHQWDYSSRDLQGWVWLGHSNEFRMVLGWSSDQPARLFFSYPGPNSVSSFFVHSFSGAVAQFFELNPYYRNGKVTYSSAGR